MSYMDSRSDRANLSSVHALPQGVATRVTWQAHTPFAQQATLALARSYAAGVDGAYLVTLARRQEALRRWRGLDPTCLQA